MIVAVTSEYHFAAGPDGTWTDAAYPYRFWAEGLGAVFEQVVIVARVKQRPLAAGHRRVDGPGVGVAAITDFTGAGGLVRRAPALAGTVAAAVRRADVVVLRAPGIVATVAHAAARALGRPHAVEVVGDPRESIVAARSGRPARLAAQLAARMLGHQVGGAVATRYVTEAALQRRYPPPPGRFTVAASDLELPDALFETAPVAIRRRSLLDVVFVGALARPYKGLDVLLAALTATARPHRLTVVGDGALRPELEAEAGRLGLGERVQFVGAVPSGPPVFDRLRAADLFVLPSRTEGLPRSLIEAMAVGLPCLATPVGGVPELVGAEAQVAVDDPVGLARAIDALAADPDRRERQAVTHRRVASRFRLSERRRRLRSFHEAIRAAVGP